MRTEYGSTAGPRTIADHLVVRGMITGDVVVERDGFLHLYGMVDGKLRVDEGGSAVVRGTVSKDVLNAGHLEVFGMIIGRLASTPTAETVIVPGAQINGVTR